jgi:hypothetical protein
LVVTTGTDLSSYYFTSDINISGQVKDGLTVISDAFVGISVLDDTNNIIFVRTVDTGTPPTMPAEAYISNVYLSDSNGNHKAYADATSTMPTYFTFTVINNDAVNPLFIQSVVSVTDIDNNILGSGSTGITIQPRQSTINTVGVIIPPRAVTGMGKVYVGVYSGYPSQGGVPYGPETSKEFEIRNGRNPIGSNPPQGINGYYQLTVKLPVDSRQGLYHIYASTEGGTTSAHSTFTATQLGDLNGDGQLSGSDLRSFVIFYLQYQNEGIYTPDVDFNNDQAITGSDIRILVLAYLYYQS